MRNTRSATDPLARLDASATDIEWRTYPAEVRWAGETTCSIVILCVSEELTSAVN